MNPDPINYLLSCGIGDTALSILASVRAWMTNNRDSWSNVMLPQLDQFIGSYLERGVAFYTYKFPGTKQQLDQAVLDVLGADRVADTARRCAELTAEPLMMELFGYVLVYCTARERWDGPAVWMRYVTAVNILAKSSYANRQEVPLPA